MEIYEHVLKRPFHWQGKTHKFLFVIELQDGPLVGGLGVGAGAGGGLEPPATHTPPPNQMQLFMMHVLFFV